MGARKGDVLALILPNVPEFVFVFTGAPLAGVTVTTIPPTMTAHEMQGQLSSSGATWVVTNKERFEVVRKAIEMIDDGWRKDMTVKGNSSEKINVVVDANRDELPQDDVIPLSLMLMNDNDSSVPEVDFDFNEDVMVIPYSSGTTGPPKGVELTHKYVLNFEVPLYFSFSGTWSVTWSRSPALAWDSFSHRTGTFGRSRFVCCRFTTCTP